ncbi:MAG: hypothetical protein HYV61_14155 [Candidatus Rokubacteria bacterium]|nr:hypothetical protein [Candidatus Rokubacteria bacterium]
MPRLVIVRQDRPSLYEYFKTYTEKPGEIAVISDRRIGERRQQPDPVPFERRRRQRRTPLSPHQEQELEEMWFRIVEI